VNADPSPIAAAIAVELITPTPGIDSRERIVSSVRLNSANSRSNAARAMERLDIDKSNPPKNSIAVLLRCLTGAVTAADFAGVASSATAPDSARFTPLEGHPE